MKKDGPLVITDPGIDDAIAIFYLASKIENCFFVSTYGNVNENESFRNLRLILDIIKSKNYLTEGIAIGPKKIINPIAQKIFGPHGIDGLNGKYAIYRNKVRYSKNVKFVRSHLELLEMFLDHGKTIITLGPPDFLKLLINKEELSNKPLEIIISGCFLHKGRFFSAEFNTFLNLNLINELSKKFNVTIIPSEVTCSINFNDLKFETDERLAHRFIRDIIPKNGKILHDVFPIYYFLNKNKKNWFKEELMPGVIDPIRGKIKFSEKGNQLHIVKNVNIKNLKRDLERSLGKL